MSEEENTSMRDALEAAIEEDNNVEENTEVTEETPARDTEGRFAAEEDAVEPDESGEVLPETGEQPADIVTDNTPEVEPLKAPQSWKASAREQWEGMPLSIQEEVLRREGDINNSLSTTADSRKMGDDLMSAAKPYMHMIEAEGSNPIQAAENMWKTAAMLKTGSPIQKAALLAEIVGTYGIDIGLLDTALSGTPMPAQQQQQQYEPQQPMQDPRFDQLLESMQQSKQAESQQRVSDFGKGHEFFNDVRLEMADIIEVYEKRGVALSLDDAYNKAIALNTDISGVISQRDAAQNANASTDKSRRAASSIKSNHASGSKQKPDSLRGALEDAIQLTG